MSAISVFYDEILVLQWIKLLSQFNHCLEGHLAIEDMTANPNFFFLDPVFDLDFPIIFTKALEKVQLCIYFIVIYHMLHCHLKILLFCRFTFPQVHKNVLEANCISVGVEQLSMI